jgi:hypothetical protein
MSSDRLSLQHCLQLGDRNYRTLALGKFALHDVKVSAAYATSMYLNEDVTPDWFRTRNVAIQERGCFHSVWRSKYTCFHNCNHPLLKIGNLGWVLFGSNRAGTCHDTTKNLAQAATDFSFSEFDPIGVGSPGS